MGQRKLKRKQPTMEMYISAMAKNANAHTHINCKCLENGKRTVNAER